MGKQGQTKIDDVIRDTMTGKLFSSDEAQTIVWEIDEENHVATITLNRPEKRNAINARMINEVDHALARFRLDDAVRVIVLKGAGPSFSSGHDLNKGPTDEGFIFRARNVEERGEWEQWMFYEKTISIWDYPKPIVAQVQGHCVAAGWMLANMCDIIIASEDALFSNPVGRMAAVGIEVAIEPWVMGIRKAKEFLLTGDPMSAEEALSLGVINKVVPLEELESAASAMARKIARLPPVTARMIKKSMNSQLEIMGIKSAAELSFQYHLLGHATQEHHELMYEKYMWKEGEGMSLKEFLRQRDAPFKND